MDELRQDPWVNFEEIERPLRIEPKILGNPDPSQISQFIVGITNNKDAIIYTLHTHVETRGSLNPAANIPASSTPSRQSAVGRRASMLIRHPEGGPSQQRGGGGGGEEDDVSPLPIDLSGAFAAKSGHRSSVSDSNAPIRRRSTISSASDASATLGVNLGSLPLTLAPISHTPSPIPDNTKDNNDVLINAPKPRMRSMSVGQRPHSIALSSDMDVKKVLAPINPTAERDTKLMRRMSMVGPSIPPIDPTEIQHQEPGGHKPGSFTLNRRASMVVPAVSRPTDLSGTAVPAPGVLMRTPSSIVDDLDPFSTDDFAFDLEPTKEEIEDWHGFHRPAKEVRTVRFSFSSNTTSSLQPALIFQEIHRVLVDLQGESDGGVYIST